MMWIVGHRPFIVTVGMLILAVACGPAAPMPTLTPSPTATAILEDDPPDQSNERISITNDESSLDDRVRMTSEDVPVEPAEHDDTTAIFQASRRLQLSSGPGGRYLGLAGAPTFRVQAAPEVTLTLVAEVSPPIANGQVLQATSVAIKGNFAYVSYNMLGEPFLGAIDVFDIKNPSNPKLVSEAIFLDSDVHSLTFDGGKVYAAEGTGAPGFETPAVWEVIKTKNGKLVLDENSRVALPSFAGTSAVVSGKYIYVTSGNTGGLSVFDKKSLELQAYVDLPDARWVDIEDDRVVVVQGGSPNGFISFLDEDNLSILNTFPFVGADILESKSSVQILGGKAFIASGRGGVQVLSINTGDVVGTVSRPVVPDLDESVVVTNAVSADDDLMFIANGEAGVYLAQAAEKFDDTGSDEPQDITLLGKLRFDNLVSVNHVEYKDGVLFVAAGQGGLKIVTVEESED
ncbi:MAG: hypothetical protein O2783_02760 [Chloroflexi bacterium]|nr:hypothetical protein [Chloroflexota bacterium]